MRPTAASDRPPSNSRIARRRRRSNSAAVPCGRMHAVYTTADDLSITYAILNKEFDVAFSQTLKGFVGQRFDVVQILNRIT
jgi:hypothetical protein